MSYVDRSKTRPGTTRRGILVGYQYTEPGFYFVTFCTHDRAHTLGAIDRETMVLSQAGSVLEGVIATCEQRFSTVSIDSRVIMPNHVHLLIGVSVRLSDETGIDSVSDVVRWVKSTCLRRYAAGVRSHGWPPYQLRMWQQGYHDHIVRNDRELEMIREYIAKNVIMWDKDIFYDF